ncbi:MAG: hypothetical protein K6C09_09100, partial [Oscillospiraceae bacterium]|nr:hypothetical protein [Oscillospiraceae bacterium]
SDCAAHSFMQVKRYTSVQLQYIIRKNIVSSKRTLKQTSFKMRYRDAAVYRLEKADNKCRLIRDAG